MPAKNDKSPWLAVLGLTRLTRDCADCAPKKQRWALSEVLKLTSCALGNRAKIRVFLLSLI